MNNANNINENVFDFTGVSMLPLIKPGSKVYMKPVSMFDYKPGDIVCFFRNSAKFYAHRLIYFKNIKGIKHILEKGDNIYGFSLIPYSDIIGKLTRIEDTKHIINLDYLPWRIANFILAKIAFLQVILLKLLPYSYHSDHVIKKIPHYCLKLFFLAIENIFICLFSKKRQILK